MKKVVILGNSRNGIFHQMVQHFLAEESEVYLIDIGTNYTHERLKVVSSSEFLGKIDKLLIGLTSRIINVSDLFFSTFYFLVLFKFRELKLFWQLPNLKRPISNMIFFSRILNRLNVDYVICLNVYFYGFCSILSTKKNVVAQPWGSDVNVYGVSSPVRFYLMKKCLTNSRYIAPAGRSVMRFIKEKYKIPTEKLVFLHPQVDSNFFHTISKLDREKIRTGFGIPSDAIVFFSCRRFAEGWGPSTIKLLFQKLAIQVPNSFFIVLSGYDRNQLLNDFRNELPHSIRHKFYFIDRIISLEEFGKYAQVSDFTVSAMTNSDMQSSSIMQSASCGAYPILLEQEEYRLMEADGFKALLFKTIDDALFIRISELVRDSETLMKLANSNSEYFKRVGSQQSYVAKLNNLSYL
ncbi:MAG: hypothetical protein ABL895_14800 [Cyclobacteriaceae bacterium]